MKSNLQEVNWIIYMDSLLYYGGYFYLITFQPQIMQEHDGIVYPFLFYFPKKMYMEFYEN